MKFLLALIILGMTFLSGCKQCGSAITFSDTCDPEIVSDATPVAPTPPSPGYTLSSSSVNVAENGGTGTYTIVLNTEPTATVTFAITSDNTSQITVAPASVSFGSGNYSTAQTITLTGVNDNIDDDNVNVNILNAISSTDTTYGALDNTTITAVNVDDDTRGYTLTGASYSYTENVPVNWQLRLSTEPVDNVTATISIINATRDNEFTIPSPIVFTPSNYASSQTLAVTARQDNEIDGTQYATVKVTLTSNDSKYNNLTNSTPNSAILDNRSGKQPNNYIAQGNYFTIAVHDNSSRPVYATGDDTLLGESYGNGDYERISLNTDNTSNVSTEGSGQIIPKRADNSNLGDNSTTSFVSTGISNAGIIVTGPSHTAVLHDNRTAVTMWGRHRMKNFGTLAGSSQYLVAQSYVAKDYDVGYEHWMIIDANNQVVGGGYARNGATGSGVRNYGEIGAVRVPQYNNVIDLALGNHHSILLLDNGSAVGFGKNEVGQLGSGLDNLSSGCDSAHCSLTPVPVANYNNIIQIDSGSRHTIALLDNGSVVGFGANDVYQYSTGNTTNYDEPQPAQDLPANILRVWADNNRSCAVSNYYKTLHCAGGFYRGDGSSTSGNFVQVDFPSDFTSNHIIKDVSISTGGVCAYTLNTSNNTSDLFCWGSNQYGQLGRGDTLTPQRTPVKITTGPFN